MNRLCSATALLLFLSACVTGQDAGYRSSARSPSAVSLPTDCEVLDLEQVFEDPGVFHGKKFCGKAIPHLSSRMDAFHPAPVDDLEQALDTALLLVDPDRAARAKLARLGPGDVVTIVGVIEADFCLKSTPKPREQCVPVRHPIFISDPSLYVEHGVSVSDMRGP